ncbi:MAG: hypothetical protein AAGD25_28290 [Cyanobacteria bacterium P01_F01_bin.150]
MTEQDQKKLGSILWAIATTTYLATLENPTDIQKQLFMTSSALALPSKGNRSCRHHQHFRPIGR